MVNTALTSLALWTLWGLIGCGPSASLEPADRFDAPAWSRPGRLFLRVDAANTDTLLLRQEPLDSTGGTAGADNAVVYRHRPTERSLKRATLDDWNRQTSGICECELQQAVSTAPLRLDAKTNTLHHGDRLVPTEGKTVLLVVVAPDRERGGKSERGKKAAVLTAEGARSGSVAPAIGQGGASGRHFHQVFTLAEGTIVGEPVELPLSSERTALGACWSADGRWIVYHDVLFRHVAILDTGVKGEGKQP